MSRPPARLSHADGERTVAVFGNGIDEIRVCRRLETGDIYG